MKFALEEWLATRGKGGKNNRPPLGADAESARLLCAWATVVALWLIAVDASAQTVYLSWLHPGHTNSGAVMTPAAIVDTVLTCDGATVATFRGSVTSGYASIETPATCSLRTTHIDVAEPIAWEIDPATGGYRMTPSPAVPIVARPRQSMASFEFAVRDYCAPPSAASVRSVIEHYAAPVLVEACVDPAVVLPTREQLTAAIAADAELQSLLTAGDWPALARALNADSTTRVWLPWVSREYLVAEGLPWTALDSLTATKWRIIDAMLSVGWVSPDDPEVRAGLTDALGPTRAAPMLARLTRTATRLELMFATRGATDPATLTVSGRIGVDTLRLLLN